MERVVAIVLVNPPPFSVEESLTKSCMRSGTKRKHKECKKKIVLSKTKAISKQWLMQMRTSAYLVSLTVNEWVRVG